jgi:hypothetical protein
MSGKRDSVFSYSTSPHLGCTHARTREPKIPNLTDNEHTGRSTAAALHSSGR